MHIYYILSLVVPGNLTLLFDERTIYGNNELGFGIRKYLGTGCASYTVSSGAAAPSLSYFLSELLIFGVALLVG
jgi:hypothetical protein